MSLSDPPKVIIYSNTNSERLVMSHAAEAVAAAAAEAADARSRLQQAAHRSDCKPRKLPLPAPRQKLGFLNLKSLVGCQL